MQKHGFSIEKNYQPNPQNCDDKVFRLSKNEVIVDILDDAVRDKEERVN